MKRSIKNNILLSIYTIFLVVFSVTALGDVIINEVMYNPDTAVQGTDAQFEWIELYNNGSNTVNLSTWQLEENDFDDVTISPDSYVVVARDKLYFESYYGNNDTVWDGNDGSYDVLDGSFALSNSGEIINLTNSTYNELFDYAPYIALGAGNKKTLARYGNTWGESLTNNGTPGKVNTFGCVVPVDNMQVYENVTFCEGTYNLEDDIIVVSDNLTINCAGAVLKNSGFYIINKTGIIIKNCVIQNTSAFFFQFLTDSIIEKNTIIDSIGRDIFMISSNDNLIRNNTLDGGNLYDGISLISGSTGNIFEYNTILRKYDGIDFQYSSDNIVRQNTIHSNQGTGIVLQLYSSSNDVYNNIIYNNSDEGIRSSQTNVNNITNNDISLNDGGIRLIGCNGCYVQDNNVYNNTDGIYVQDTNYPNYVFYNTAYNNEDDGIQLAFANNTLIEGNTLYSNDDGVYFDQGCQNNVVNSNIIYSNYEGIEFSDDDTGYNNITNNDIYSNDKGISIREGLGHHNVLDNNVTDNQKGIYIEETNYNNILDNNVFSNQVGIYIDDESSVVAINNTISSNEIYNNTLYNFDNNQTYEVKAENNYWGLFTYDAIKATINGDVDFDPWIGKQEEVPAGQDDYIVDAKEESGTELIIDTTGSTTVTISSANKTNKGNTSDPYDAGSFTASKLKTLQKTISIEASNQSAITWPVLIKIYYNQTDLDNAGITEDKLVGIFYWNNNLWELVNETGVNTTDISINGRDYAGYLWANLYHFSEYAPGSDVTEPVTTDVNVTPSQTNSNPVLTASITDDTLYNWSKITSAEYFIDGYGADGTGTAMTAQDGSFDSESEMVTATINIAALSDGNHTLSVHGLDENNNWGNFSNSTFIVDTVGPEVTAFNNPSDQQNLSGAFTLNVTVTDSIAGVDTVYFNVSRGGSSVIVAASNTALNYYTGTLDSTLLSEGDNNITVYANDTLNNLNDSVYRTVTIDNTNPKASFENLNDDDNVSGTILINVSLTDVTSGLETVTIKNGTSNQIPVTLQSGTINDGYYDLSIDTTTILNGEYNFSITGTDFAGNINSTEHVTVNVDNSNPTSSFVSHAIGNNVTGTIAIKVNAGETSPETGVKEVRVRNGTNNWIPLSLSEGDIYDGNWTASFETQAVSEGALSLTINATDFVGNSDTTQSIVLTVDNTRPTASFIEPATGANISGNFMINLTAADITSGVKYLMVQNGSSNWISVPIQSGDINNGHYNITLDSTAMPNGLSTFTINATDFVGNENSSVTRQVMIDNVNPTVTINTPQAINYTGTILLNATVTDVHSTVQNVYFTITNASTPVTVNPARSGDSYTFNYDTSDLEDGYHIMTVYSVDYAGNINNTETILFGTDNKAPDFFSLTKEPVPGYNDDSVTLNATINDTFTGVSTVWLESNFSGTWQNYTNGALSIVGDKYSYTIPASELDNQEIVLYRWYSNDTLGNMNSSVIQSFQVSNRAPIFNTSKNISNLAWVEDSGEGSVNLSGRYYDLDEDSLTYTAVVESLPAGGLSYSINNATGIATITSAADWNGVGNITFYGVDFVGASASSNLVLITVQDDENEAPELTSPITPINYSEDSSITFTLSCDPKNIGQSCENFRYDPTYVEFNNNITVDINDSTGVVTMSARENWYGLSYVKFLADDNGTPVMSDSLTVKVNISSVNDYPVINYSTGNINQTVDEDAGSWTFDLTPFETDVDYEDVDTNLTWSIGNVDTSLISVSLNTTTDVVTFTAVPNAHGTNLLQINLTDSHNAKVQGHMLVTVNSVNDMPFINATIGPYTILDNTDTTIDLTGYANDDNDTFTSSLDWDVTVGNASLWTYADDSAGQTVLLIPKEITDVNPVNDTVTFIVSDGAAQDSVDVVVTISPFNDAPSIPNLVSPLNASTQTSATGNFTLDWSDSIDNEMQPLSYYVFFGETPTLNATASSSQYTVSSLESNTTYKWYVVASDGVNNATKSDTWQFTTDLDNAPNVTGYEPASSTFSLAEGSTMLFNATLLDVDGNLISYNWTVDGLEVSSETTATYSETVSYSYTPGYEDAGARTVQLSIKDSNGNIGNSVSWAVNVGDTNRAPSITSSPMTSFVEDIAYNFNLEGTDPDADSLTFTSNITGMTITAVNDTVSQVSWTPDNDDVGTQVVEYTVSDGSLTDTQLVTLNVTNTPDAPVISTYAPTSPVSMAANTGSQVFSLTAVEPDPYSTVSLSINWYLDGSYTGDTDIYAGTPQTLSGSHTLSGLSSGTYNFTAIVTDGDSLDTTISWVVQVTTDILSSEYTGTILSHATTEEEASGITIDESTYGTIAFSEDVNLSNAGNIDSYVEIRQGVVAIDSSFLEGFNRAATITMRNLNYTKAPLIYYHGSFNTVTGGNICPDTRCSNIAYNPGTGVLTLDVTGFSTYYTQTNTTNGAPSITSTALTSARAEEAYSYDVNGFDPDGDTLSFSLPSAPFGMSINSGSGVISWTPTDNQTGTNSVTVQVSDGSLTGSQTFDIIVGEPLKLRITDVDVEVDKRNDKNLMDGETIKREAVPESEVDFEIEVESAFASGSLDIEDVVIEVTIRDIDDGDDMEEESKEFDLRPGKDKSQTLSFLLPLKVDEDTFTVDIHVEGEDENGTLHEADRTVYLVVDKEKHDVRISRYLLSPSIVRCQDSTSLDVEIINLGSDDEEEVAIEVSAPDIDFYQKISDIRLDEGSDDDSEYDRIFRIPVSDKIGVGTYPITVTTYYDSEDESDTETKYLDVIECRTTVTQETPVEKKADDEDFEVKNLEPVVTQPEPVTEERSFTDTEEYFVLLIVLFIVLAGTVIFTIGAAVMLLRR